MNNIRLVWKVANWFQGATRRQHKRFCNGTVALKLSSKGAIKAVRVKRRR